MDIHNIRQLLKTKTIYDIPMRVTFYARVSSESDEQLNSLGNQIQYYENLIRKNTNWTYVEGYIDEGLSVPSFFWFSLILSRKHSAVRAAAARLSRDVNSFSR